MERHHTGKESYSYKDVSVFAPAVKLGKFLLAEAQTLLPSHVLMHTLILPNKTLKIKRCVSQNETVHYIQSSGFLTPIYSFVLS